MTTIDERVMPAPADLCFSVAADVEHWPEILPHYRWVHLRPPEHDGVTRVEMAAWRNFAGPLRYPTWWLSEMRLAEAEPAIYFRHIGGITTGMTVKWAFTPAAEGTLVSITHTWNGPPWPLIGGFAWRHVIGPHFVSFIAARTLLGVSREAQRRHLQEPA